MRTQTSVKSEVRASVAVLDWSDVRGRKLMGVLCCTGVVSAQTYSEL